MDKKELYFITSNTGKFATMKKYADAAGITAIQKDLPLIEPQADTILEISRSKAKQAFAFLQHPLIVNDAGMYIDGLKGFPGPYVKFVVQTIGVEGVKHLAEPLTDRRCHFVSVLTYIDQHQEKSFESITEGHLAMEIDDTPKPFYYWSDMQRLFIPEGWQKPLTGFTEGEWHQWYTEQEHKNVFGQVIQWLAKS